MNRFQVVHIGHFGSGIGLPIGAVIGLMPKRMILTPPLSSASPPPSGPLWDLFFSAHLKKPTIHRTQSPKS